MAEPAAPAVDRQAIRDEIAAALKEAGGDAKEALIRQNVKLRDRAARAEAEAAELKKKVPAEGAVVLTGDDAKAWEAYRALNLKPDEVKAAITERDALKATDTARTKKDARHAAAKAAGYDPDVLDSISGIDALAFSVKKEPDAKGKEVEVAYVTTAEQGATPKKLAEYVSEKHAKLLPALTATNTQDRGTGTQWPRQEGGGTGGGAKDPVSEFAERRAQQRAARPNPLAPAQPAQPAAKTQ